VGLECCGFHGIRTAVVARVSRATTAVSNVEVTSQKSVAGVGLYTLMSAGFF